MRRANSKCMPISCLFIYNSGALFQYFKICLISHDSVTTQSLENGGVDSACFFTESTQSSTPTPTAGITSTYKFQQRRYCCKNSCKIGGCPKAICNTFSSQLAWWCLLKLHK